MAEHLASDASFVDVHGNPVDRDGALLLPHQHQALIGRALLHAVLAIAAQLIDDITSETTPAPAASSAGADQAPTT
jgi:hypothetical protein